MLRLRVPIMLDPYFGGDGSARRMEGKVLAVCICGDARRRWWWRQGEVKDKLSLQWDPPFRYVEVVGGGDVPSVAFVLDFQKNGSW